MLKKILIPCDNKKTSIKFLIDLYLCSYGAMTNEKGQIIEILSRKILGTVDFSKSSYDYENGELIMNYTSTSPLEFVVLKGTILNE